jgi:DNA polymerase-3 subunit alpha
MAASMTLDLGNTDKLSDFCVEAKRMGIEVLPPCVNRSGVHFTVEDGAVRYAMGAIKGVGEGAVEHIIEMRGDKPFDSLGDFASRVSAKQLNKRILESLINAGAFDALEKNRARVLAGIDRIIGVAQRTEEQAISGQNDMFGGGPAGEHVQLPETDAWLAEEQLQREQGAIGFYLSAHPLDAYMPLLQRMRVQMWNEFAQAVKQGASAGRLAGTVLSRQERKTRSGNRMGIVRLSDPTGQYEALLFSEALAQFRDAVEPGRSVVLLVGADMRDDEPSLRIQSVRPLEEEASRVQQSLTVFLQGTDAARRLQRHLGERGEGEVSVVVLLEDGRREVEVKLPGGFRLTPQLAGAVKTIPGVVNVELA